MLRSYLFVKRKIRMHPDANSLDAIRTPRLSLKPFSPADADEVFGALTPTLTRYMSFEPPTRDEFEGIWRQWIRSMEDASEFTFVVRRLQTDQFVGVAALHRRDVDEPELGIWVSEQEHGHGYGGEAVKALIDWSNVRFCPAAYRYPVAVANQASRRIAERLGGKLSGQETSVKFASVVYRVPSRQFP